MKFLTIIIVLIGITAFNSCKKETVVISPVQTVEPVVADTTAEEVDTVWMYYDETYCYDPWGHFDVLEQEKKVNIENYFNDLNVEVFEIEISEENLPDDCFSCGCHSGFTIKCRILLEGVNVLINEEFYQ
jgi:hypothetical protein